MAYKICSYMAMKIMLHYIQALCYIYKIYAHIICSENTGYVIGGSTQSTTVCIIQQYEIRQAMARKMAWYMHGIVHARQVSSKMKRE